MMLFKNFAGPGISVVLMMLLGVCSAAQAESVCKGLASSQCSGKSDCVWVGGYTRKDNRKVSGYCRAKGGKGATTNSKTKSKKAPSSRDSRSTSKQSAPEAKKKSSSKNKKVTEKESAKQSSGKKSKKEKTTTKKKSAKKSKSDSSKAKTKDK